MILKSRNRSKLGQALTPIKRRFHVSYLKKQQVPRIPVKIINGMSVSSLIHRGCSEDVKEARTNPSPTPPHPSPPPPPPPNLATAFHSTQSAFKCTPLFQGRAGESAALSHGSSVTTARKTTHRSTVLVWRERVPVPHLTKQQKQNPKCRVAGKQPLAKIMRVREADPVDEMKRFSPAPAWVSLHKARGRKPTFEGKRRGAWGAAIWLCSLPDTKPLLPPQTERAEQ